MSLAAWTGEVRLQPGSATQAVRSSRPDWVPRLSVGRPAVAWPGLVASLFTLCGHAHRWTAERALQAAQGQAQASDPGQPTRHRLATLREQLLRIHHDWPRLLPGAPPPLALAEALRSAPVWLEAGTPAERLAAMPAWLAQAWLGQPVAVWLGHWQADPQGWPLRWLADARGPLAELLRSQQLAQQLSATGPALRLQHPADWQALAGRLWDEPGFALHPHWQGQVPDTGPWSRLAWPVPATSAWDRLLARVVEVLQLAQPGGEAWLAHGALALGPGAGLAWAEMSRGLLVHQVQLTADGQTLVDARVLAPTEWNVHPEGVLARAVAALPAEPAACDAARRLAVAFDPCVPVTVHLGDTAKPQEQTCTS